ncbi:hypothetical protein V5799_023682 [Amblyomma americanum]|uniref:Secreted protein n=1 Tax=Amblyomma americanum TaxID=6943 RepID=A0AAQ4FIK6_AMBAM
MVTPLAELLNSAELHLLILGALALPHRTDSNETTSKITAAPSKTLGIPVREGDIPLEAMRFVVPYMNTWATPADCCANGGTCIHGENGKPPSISRYRCLLTSCSAREKLVKKKKLFTYVQLKR